MKKLLLTTFLLIILIILAFIIFLILDNKENKEAISTNDNIEYREVISTNLYKTNKIQIVRVHFDFNKTNLVKEFIEDSIIPSLETNKNILKIYIEGHTDSKGRAEYNYGLGLNRAKTVSNIIFTNRNLQNIALKSFGYSNSIADNSTEEGRAINRRADIFIDLVEETFELQTNLIKVDSKNKFNIDLWILLIILLLILLIIIIIILIKSILIKSIFSSFPEMLNFVQKIHMPEFLKKIIYKIIYNEWLKKLKEFLQEALKSTNPTKRGNIGEQLTALDKVVKRGWKMISPENLPKDMNDEGRQGIDAIFEKDGKFIIVDSKYRTSGLQDTDDGKQMSRTWIKPRIEPYCGADKKLAERIKSELKKGNIKCMVAKISEGLNNIEYKLLDKNANYTGELCK